MRARRLIHWFLLMSGMVVGVSFGYGGYLMRVRHAPPQLSVVAPAEGSVQSLVKTAAPYLESKHVEQALVTYRKALTLDPNSIDAQLGIARGELLAGRESVAAREYERALLLDRNNATALQQLARIYSHDRVNWGKAEDRYREFLRIRPDQATARLELARVLSWEKKPKQAVEMFDTPGVRSLMTAADRNDYKLQLASVYASSHDWDHALPLYSELLQQNPDDLRLNLTYGLGLLANKNYARALGPLERARKGLPENTEAQLGYARALKGSGNLKKAAREFGHAVDSSKDPALVREYADLLLEKHDYRGAEKAYKRASQLGLHDTRLMLGLAGALRGVGKSREAIPYLEQAYANDPTDRTAFELASTLQKVGRNQEALALLNKIDKPSSR